jgi:hypothetical protein
VPPVASTERGQRGTLELIPVTQITESGAPSPVVELRQIAGSGRGHGTLADVVMARWTALAASAEPAFGRGCALEGLPSACFPSAARRGVGGNASKQPG